MVMVLNELYLYDDIDSHAFPQEFSNNAWNWNIY